MRLIELRASKPRYLIYAMLAVVFVVMMVAFITSSAHAQSPLVRDFFGTVVSVNGNVVIVSTTSAVVEVTTNKDTTVRLPLRRDATISDLLEGDQVAISMEDNSGVMVADIIHVVPSKTQHRHIPGEVVAVAGGKLSITPMGSAEELLTFNITRNTKTAFHNGSSRMAEGAFVIVLAVRNPSTGVLSPDALEVHVIADYGPIAPSAPGQPPAVSEPENTVRIKGIFEGVDNEGNWIVSDTPVEIEPKTRIQSGIAFGQIVEVEGEFRPDGSILASEIQPREDGYQLSDRMVIEGIFEGVDRLDRWIISGTPVTILSLADTDGIPFAGQRVRMVGLVGEDGSIIAREIENKNEFINESGPFETRIQGIFYGVDANAQWVISGLRVSVGKDTRLYGTPTVGSYIEVRAVRAEDGTLSANKIRLERRLDEETDLKEGVEVKGIAQIRGQIDSVARDSNNKPVGLEVDGYEIVLSQLTEINGGLRIGNAVQIEAVMLHDSTLIARIINAGSRIQEPSSQTRVEMKGVIRSINEDRSITLMNGLRVVFGPTSSVAGPLVLGATVKVEGTLQENGAILAQVLTQESDVITDPTTEQRIEGVIDEVMIRDNRIVGISVDGRLVSIEALTDKEVALRKGAYVSIRAIISEKGLLAKEIEGGPSSSSSANSTSNFSNLVQNIVDAPSILRTSTIRLP